MKLPLMPKATAIWLIENTSLSFNQIAEFCGLHELEVQGIADGDVATGMQGYDAIDNKQLTREEITRCENDPTANLELIKSFSFLITGFLYLPITPVKSQTDFQKTLFFSTLQR